MAAARRLLRCYGNILGIVFSVQKPGGTQLKLVMSFPNYGQAMFKPMK